MNLITDINFKNKIALIRVDYNVPLNSNLEVSDNTRIKNSIKNKNFISRIFSKKEINQSKKIKDKTNYYSKRFAAKESLSKAIGTGFRNDLNFSDISVVKDRYGKPSIKLNTKIKNIIKKRFKTIKVNVFLSLSDEKKHSIAFVVLGKNES